MAPARLLWPGSGLTGRRSLLVYRLRFRSTSYVFTEKYLVKVILIPYIAHGCSRPYSPAPRVNPHPDQGLYIVLSFPLADQAS